MTTILPGVQGVRLVGWSLWGGDDDDEDDDDEDDDDEYDDDINMIITEGMVMMLRWQNRPV